MALIRTKGLVVKEVAVNDADKIITLISEDLGRISVSAKGARKSGSRYAYGAQVLTYGDFILFKSRNSYSMNGCDIIASFYCLAGDLERFTHAAHMIDMASDAATDIHTSAQVLNLLLHALNALAKGRNALLVSSAFSLKLTRISGYPPHVTSCANCGTDSMEAIFFSFVHCGFVCENCARTESDAVHVESGTAKAILHVLCSENNNAFRFDLATDNLTAFSAITARYISERADKKYDKLDFLKGLSPEYNHLGGNGRL